MNETVAAVNQPKTQFKDYPDVLTVCPVGGSDRPSGSGRTMCWTICASKNCESNK